MTNTAARTHEYTAACAPNTLETCNHRKNKHLKCLRLRGATVKGGPHATTLHYDHCITNKLPAARTNRDPCIYTSGC